MNERSSLRAYRNHGLQSRKKRGAAEKRVQQLNKALQRLQELCDSQTKPTNRVAVKKAGTPVFAHPEESGKPLFVAMVKAKHLPWKLGATARQEREVVFGAAGAVGGCRAFYSPALTASISTTAMFCSRSCDSPCRSFR